jgi:hypothetical protein
MQRLEKEISDLKRNSEVFLLGGDSLRKSNKNPNPPAED